MYSKDKGVPDGCIAEARRRLATYVHGYLLQVGAPKAADLFLSEINWDKNARMEGQSGFLQSWWQIFWDLYSTAPDPREIDKNYSNGRFLSRRHAERSSNGAQTQGTIPNTMFPGNPIGHHPFNQFDQMQQRPCMGPCLAQGSSSRMRRPLGNELLTHSMPSRGPWYSQQMLTPSYQPVYYPRLRGTAPSHSLLGPRGGRIRGSRQVGRPPLRYNNPSQINPFPAPSQNYEKASTTSTSVIQHSSNYSMMEPSTSSKQHVEFSPRTESRTGRLINSVMNADSLGLGSSSANDFDSSRGSETSTSDFDTQGYNSFMANDTNPEILNITEKIREEVKQFEKNCDSPSLVLL